MKWNSLFPPFIWNSRFLSRMCVWLGGGSDGLNRGEIVIMHYPPFHICHFAPYLSLALRTCLGLLNRTDETPADLSQSITPHVELHLLDQVGLLLSSQLSVVFCFCFFFVSSYAPQSPRHLRSVRRVAASKALC